MSHFGRSGPSDIKDTYSLLVLNIRAARVKRLGAKAATISLSAFGLGGPFGFDAFSKKWKKESKKSSSSKNESSKIASLKKEIESVRKHSKKYRDIHVAIPVPVVSLI